MTAANRGLLTTDAQRRVASGMSPADDRAFPPETIRSATFRAALTRLERYATFDHVTVVLEGESGTGKTFFARHLHRLSPRREGAFHHLNLASLDDSFVSSDLFGHVSGAFTGADRARPGLFASAQGGTVFLDEIGKASDRVQCRLLSAIERLVVRPLGSDREVPVNVRLIAATNVPLETLVSAGTFLSDLAPRLGQFRVRIPALRERPEDIPGLVAMFLRRHSPQFGYARAPEIDEELVRALTIADWPGNVRELDGTIQRLLAVADGAATLSLEHCEDNLAYLARLVRNPTREPLTPRQIEQVVSDVGSISKAARNLGVARSTVQRHLRKAIRSDEPSQTPNDFTL